MSRQLFDKWCSYKHNACVRLGYVVVGTLAKFIIIKLKDVILMNGLTAPLNMQAHYVSFSAHAVRSTDDRTTRHQLDDAQSSLSRSFRDSSAIALPQLRYCLPWEASTFNFVNTFHLKHGTNDDPLIGLEQLYECVESLMDEETGVPALQVHDGATVKVYFSALESRSHQLYGPRLDSGCDSKFQQGDAESGARIRACNR
ncbi:hypothetical protein RJ639_024636 [Escallonia herrerae]|uniref:Uncharacterized protein n=1 Tax=Escallonia herrerae TaxID=1293975 RepID=A0AA88V364_9ASTE|nr:hypothetical protein RJ639_024636 [Escallonia herrerae]